MTSTASTASTANTSSVASVGKIFRDRMVNQIKGGVEENSNLFLLSYRNISGIQMNSLRKSLKKVGAQMYVTRNSIIQIALKGLEQKDLADRVEGQTALVWSNTDSVEVSKVLVKFTKDFQGILLKGGLLEGKLLNQGDITTLSDLPSKNVLRSILLATILAPLTRLAGAFNAKSSDLLSILKQLSEKKGGN